VSVGLKECRQIATRFVNEAHPSKATLQWAFVAEYLAVSVIRQSLRRV
jgi:hypothetical protein